jgi:L-ascorbate metabolism protein UlaG (beta-lactamase superfamily)
VQIVYIGGPTAVLELDGTRVLLDPTFDPPGDYPIGNRVLTKTAGPALQPGDVGPLDAVLLSHDQHPDNLDGEGRVFLTSAPLVLSTRSAAERVAGVTALPNWTDAEVAGLRVTGVPAQHGPDGTDDITGPGIGFLLRADGLPTVYVSGDNASVEVVERIVEREGVVEIAVLFAGGASLEGRFDGALLTLGGAQAVHAAKVLGARAVIPVHQQGWAHFSVPPEELRHAFDAAGLASVLVSLGPGQTVAV